MTLLLWDSYSVCVTLCRLYYGNINIIGGTNIFRVKTNKTQPKKLGWFFFYVFILFYFFLFGGFSWVGFFNASPGSRSVRNLYYDLKII